MFFELWIIWLYLGIVESVINIETNLPIVKYIDVTFLDL